MIIEMTHLLGVFTKSQPVIEIEKSLLRLVPMAFGSMSI